MNGIRCETSTIFLCQYLNAMYELDYSAKRTIQLSNDAFYYLLSGEEPLDDNNIDEAEEILSLFPNGFYIEKGWEIIDNSDLIAASFIPYIPIDDLDYDEVSDLTKYIQQQIKWLDSNHIKLYHLNKETRKRIYKGEFEVRVNEFGKKYFQTGDYTKGKGCLFFMKYFHKP